MPFAFEEISTQEAHFNSEFENWGTYCVCVQVPQLHQSNRDLEPSGNRSRIEFFPVTLIEEITSFSTNCYLKKKRISFCSRFSLVGEF